MPQLFASLDVFAQPPAQTCWFAGQVQTLAVHVAPVGHAWLQAPQLLLSVVSLTHVLTPLLMQAVVPEGHPQTPDVHVPPTAHLVPHAPQSVGLLAVF